jgi:hypothetical protein
MGASSICFSVFLCFLPDTRRLRLTAKIPLPPACSKAPGEARANLKLVHLDGSAAD